MNACICLSKQEATGLLSEEHTLFLVRFEVQECLVFGGLWRPDTSQIESFRNVQHWLTSRGYRPVPHFDDTVLQCMWDLSQLEA